MAKIKTISLFIVLVLLGKIGYGQNDPRSEGQFMDYTNIKMAESPTASQFNAVGDIQVNAAKGIPNISIPLYTYELDGVKVPIALSYDASGVRVSQMATSVGLGWSLNTGGQISRTVRAKPDEEPINGWFDDGYIRLGYYADKDPNNKTWQQQMKGHMVNQYNGLVKKRDHNPDLFSYSFLGHSGTYIHDTNLNIVKEKTDGISILSFGNAEDDLGAYDLDGNYYHFDYDDTEQSINRNTFVTDTGLPLDFSDLEAVDGLPIVTAWKLSNITTKNNKKIEFEYESEPMDYTIARESWQVTVGTACYSGGENPDVKSSTGTNVEHVFTTLLVTKISSPDSSVEVEFEYGTDSGLPDSVWKRKLTKITISDAQTTYRREFHFSYSRFPGDPRLRLDSIQEMAFDKGVLVQKPAYTFQYQEGSLPSKDSNAQDFYGYYNLANSNNGLLPDIFNVQTNYRQYFDRWSGDRSLNSSGLKRGVLTQITYPTGGETLFDYEPNVENLSSLSGYRGGLRIKEIKNVNEENAEFNRKTYQYNNLTGEDLETGIYQWFYKSEGFTKSYFSHPVRLPGDIGGYKSGYFYGRVTVLSHSDNSSENFKKEYRYIENLYNLQSYDYALQSEITYQGTSSQPLKIVEYENGLVSSSGNSETIEWYVVGDMDCYHPPYFPSKIGYTVNPRRIRYTGNYAYLPKDIYTTEFRGPGHDPVTTQKHISYDASTLLKTQEIVDTRKTREEDQNGTVSYPITHYNGEITTTDYQYPWSDVIDLSDLPKALPISKVTYNDHFEGGSKPIFGQYFEYDNNGNIKKTFQYNKGEGTNTTGSYIPGDYEQMTSFLFSNGKPVQTLDKYGVPTSYIWAFHGQKPVAKIVGRARSAINQSKLQAVENATYSGLEAALTALRTDASVAGAMVTTYTYEPLKGVKTITDPKGDTITYFYDAFGRLVQVKDKQNRILSENEYNYAH